jgi:hypothetical protein
MVSVETRPGILNDKDIQLAMDKIGGIAQNGAKILVSAFENESLRSDYGVTILARG